MGSDIDSATSEFVHVFNTAVTYKVTSSDKSSSLILPECFTIQGKKAQNILFFTQDNSFIRVHLL